MKKGALVMVGTGIQVYAHLTAETQSWIETADLVYYAAAESLTGDWLKELNPNTIPFPTYFTDRPRKDTYHHWSDLLLEGVRAGKHVCGVFYGHPGTFVTTSHLAIAEAKAEGFDARMLPGISATACLFADFPGCLDYYGYASYEASHFLARKPNLDNDATLILWQIKIIGNFNAPKDQVDRNALSQLRDLLLNHYPADHQVYLYEAAQYVIRKARIEPIALANLAQANVSNITSLVIPGRNPAPF